MSLKNPSQSFYQSWIVDWLFIPFTYAAARYLKYISRLGYKRILVTEKIFMRVGMLPVPDHFYQPLINPKKHLVNSLRKDRDLPGIDWNADFQLAFLRNFNYHIDIMLERISATEISVFHGLKNKNERFGWVPCF